jgi:hypothetical protein
MRSPCHSWVSVILPALLLTQSRAAAPASVPEDIRLPFTEHTVKNGMRFLIVERHDSPTFAACLRFQAGSANEPPGFAGLAHLLEDMMFKGTTPFGTLDSGRELPLLNKIDALQADGAGAVILRERNAKWRLCTWLQRAIRHPLLAEWLVSRLSRRPTLTALFMAAVGDLIPARDLGPLGFLARLLAGAEPPQTWPADLP